MLGVTDILDLADRFKIVDKIKSIYKKITNKDKKEPESDMDEEVPDKKNNTGPKIIIDEDIPYSDLEKRLEIYDTILGKNGTIIYEEYGNTNSHLKLLVVDDLKTISSYYINLLENYTSKYNVDVFNKYHIIIFTGEKCGYRAYKYIKENKIHLALLDITLNQSIKYQVGDNIYYMTIDGADIASLISHTQSDVRYMFNTGHRISDDNIIIQKYLIKIKAICNKFMLEYDSLFINKDSLNIIDRINRYLSNNKRPEDG